ncbi:MAG TPA: putative peptide modification system cyclase [Rhodanobacteraceae bacterium]|nr:putative peptide modification system cyclase [Rhodanobacteraceae bacterium]
MAAAVPTSVDQKEPSAVSVLRTLVLCDLVDSTALVERLGDQRGAELIRNHDRFARALMLEHGGKEIDKTDGFLLMFERPIQAVAFALAYQRGLAALGAEENVPLAARVGVHVGEVVVWDNAPGDVQRGAKKTEVEGLVKPVAARLMQLALPGQILLSGVAYDIAHRAQGELGEALDKVRWRTHGRYRFKGVPEPVPVFEVGEEGIAPLRPPPWTSKAHRETPIWRRPIAVGLEIAALVALIGVPLFYLTRPTPAIAFANRDFVVVGDLKNLTGDKAFDDSLQAAFRVGLEQSRYINVIPDLQVRGALKRMERDATTAVDRSVGSEIALREGARALVLPTIAEVGGRVRLTAEIVDPATQTSVYSDSVDGSGEDSVLPTMDDLLKKMRARLGESLASIGETSAPLEDVTTKNLDALKAYSLGLRAMADGKGGEALALFNQAVSLDPTFAQAYLYLGNVYYTIGQRAKAYTYVMQAAQHLDRLSAREKLSAEGYAAFFKTPAEMREKWSVFAKLYPDAMAGQQNLAVVEWWFDNALAKSAEEFRAVAESRHPRRGYAWMSLGDVELALGDANAARTSYAKAREVGAPQLYLDPLNLPIAERDYAAADKALAAEDTHQFPAFEAEKAMRTASLEVSRGRYASARAAASHAAEIAGKAGLETSRLRAELAGIAIALAQGERDAHADLVRFIDAEIKRSAGAAASFDYSSYANLGIAAELALRNGEPAAASRAIATLKPLVGDGAYFNLSQPYRAAECEARIANDAKDAVHCLEAMLSDQSYYGTRVALLHAYRAAGDDARALETARWLADHRGRAVAEWIDQFVAQVPNLIASDEALVDAAALAAKTGDAKGAALLRARFEKAWPSPEGEPPLLQRARALAKPALAKPAPGKPSAALRKEDQADVIGDVALDLVPLRGEILLRRQAAHGRNLLWIDLESVFGEPGFRIAEDLLAERVVGAETVEKRVELRGHGGSPVG